MALCLRGRGRGCSPQIGPIAGLCLPWSPPAPALCLGNPALPQLAGPRGSGQTDAAEGLCGAWEVEVALIPHLGGLQAVTVPEIFEPQEAPEVSPAHPEERGLSAGGHALCPVSRSHAWCCLGRGAVPGADLEAGSAPLAACCWNSVW